MTKTHHTPSQDATKQQPLKQFRLHGTAATIWQKTHDGKVFYTISLDRSYRAKDGTWQRTSRFSREELAVIMRLATKAEEFLDRLEAEQA